MEINVQKSHYHEDTELRLGLPGSNKRSASDVSEMSTSGTQNELAELAPPKKVQAIGWPPVRSSYRKNLVKPTATILVKVSMDGAPYLRKIDLNLYKGYSELLKALEDMFKYKVGDEGSDYEASYEDKDGDLMLVGDVPWQMFTTSCKRLRIIKSSGIKDE